MQLRQLKDKEGVPEQRRLGNPEPGYIFIQTYTLIDLKQLRPMLQKQRMQHKESVSGQRRLENSACTPLFKSSTCSTKADSRQG